MTSCCVSQNGNFFFIVVNSIKDFGTNTVLHLADMPTFFLSKVTFKNGHEKPVQTILPMQIVKQFLAIGALDNLRMFITSKETPGASSLESNLPLNTPTITFRAKRTTIAKGPLAYVAGFAVAYCI